MTASLFSKSFRPPPPRGGEVFIWKTTLDLEPAVVNDLRGLLSEDELQRADRFRLERDRTRFIAARGILRQLLGRYLEIKPKDVCFSYGPYGKPYLHKQHDHLSFNISHARGLALFAFSGGQEVGVDVEYCDHAVDVAKLFRYVFDEGTIADLSRLSSNERSQAFYREWTRKESIAKASGIGIAELLNEPRKRGTLTSHHFDRTHGRGINTWSLDIGNKYVAAVAAKERFHVIENTLDECQKIC